MTRRRTDGKRIADRVFFGRYEGPKGAKFPSELARDIDRLIRKRMAEAWDQGWRCSNDFWEAPHIWTEDLLGNPYRGRKRK